MAIKKNQPDALANRMRAVIAPAAPAAAQKPLPKVSTAARRHRAQRDDKFKPAVLVLATGERVEVVVKNLSDTGARVGFYAGGGSISGHVLLLEPSLGLKRAARVVWKDQNSAGLAFDGHEAIPAAQSEAARRQ